MNNMLAALTGNAYLAKANVHDAEKHAQYLDNIGLLVDSAADMIKQLLTFARKDQVEKRYFSLNQFMVDEYSLAKTVIPENIEHITDFCSEDLIIYGNATQFQQVMMNLPLSEKKSEQIDVMEEIPFLSPAGETILLVDDDDTLRNTTREVLERLDYKVIEAVDGEQGLQIFNDSDQDISMIITDVVMPKMGGFDFIKSVRVVNQNIPVIFIFGMAFRNSPYLMVP